MMYIGVSKLVFRADYLHSLKKKRSLVSSMKSRVKRTHQVSYAEVSDQDTHDIISLGFSVVTNDKDLARRILEQIADLLLDDFDVTLVRESLSVDSYEEDFNEF